MIDLENQEVDIQYPVLDKENSVANISIKRTKVENEKSFIVDDVFSDFTSEAYLIVENEGKTSSLTITHNDCQKENKLEQDITMEIVEGASAIRIGDLEEEFALYSNGHLRMKFGKNFKGSFYAIGKHSEV